MASTPVVRARPISHARGVPNPRWIAHQSDTTTTTGACNSDTNEEWIWNKKLNY
jgi:hypothetical protein